MKNYAAAPDYTTVTEAPSNRATREQLDRLYTRYVFASGYCSRKDVLEVACGAGLGLGYLARSARQVVGGDIDEGNLRHALSAYRGRANIEIRKLDAHELPFKDSSFDTVLLYEAIYYLAEPERFLNEAWRVLRKNGSLIICTANREWPGFNPSPLSRYYFSAGELYALLGEKGFYAELFGYCEVNDDALKDRLKGLLKVLAVRLNLMPRTMKGKELLKRLFHGRLTPIPAEITDGIARYIRPQRIVSDGPMRRHKVLLAVASKRLP